MKIDYSLIAKQIIASGSSESLAEYNEGINRRNAEREERRKARMLERVEIGARDQFIEVDEREKMGYGRGRNTGD